MTLKEIELPNWRVWVWVGVLRIVLAACCSMASELLQQPEVGRFCLIVCPEIEWVRDWATQLMVVGWNDCITSAALCIPFSAFLVEVDTLAFGYALALMVPIFEK